MEKFRKGGLSQVGVTKWGRMEGLRGGPVHMKVEIGERKKQSLKK